jgi:hypothetical protein
MGQTTELTIKTGWEAVRTMILVKGCLNTDSEGVFSGRQMSLNGQLTWSCVVSSMSFRPCAAWILFNGAEAHERLAASIPIVRLLVCVRSVLSSCTPIRYEHWRFRRSSAVCCGATGSTPVNHTLLKVRETSRCPRSDDTLSLGLVMLLCHKNAIFGGWKRQLWC